ncbi:hypothetical protein [Nocardioides lianchengensis]|uniref:Uncharacterized protein n=1 Tax=Nocardioides lianchengensis TaxID=1045774 RepID=A0A1G6L2E1_9ACTN|nr:hypothetical protein [Nocardioides lianchengensis]NYG12711.1 hypothetical protein [Nocardioides lianchengensis]SDC37347.1 hypothetical protein SAMN05421872_10290 [Nocardioides lianchengensis]
MYARALATTALSYGVLHHLGLLPDGLGTGPDGTRWADWLDLLVPWLVLAPAAWTMVAAEADRRTWLLFGMGALAYANGHGIHLAGNSLANTEPGPTAHLWDEVVGHAIWYAGVALVVAALATTMRGRPRPPWIGYPLALGVGLTWATNAVGGGTVVPALVLALAASAWGWQRRAELGVVLLVGFLPGAVLLAGELIGRLSQ